MSPETGRVREDACARYHELRLWEWALVGIGAIFLASYLVLALARIGYPYELQWMEGGSVDHVARVLRGQPLYVRPSLDFTPFLYTPLYYYLSAGVASLTGIGFMPLRLVSLLASLGCCALIFTLAWREAGQRVAGWVAVGLFAATYRLSSAWFDLARVDSLALCLLLGALYCLRHVRGVHGRMLAGALVVLSFFTKQTMLLSVLPVLCYYGIWDRRSLRVLLPVIGIGLFVGLGIMHLQTAGWSTYYCLLLPRQHPIEPIKWLSFWGVDLLPHLPIALFGAISLFVGARRLDREARRWHGCMALGLIGSAYIGRLHSGGYVNVVMPAYAAIALLSGLAVAQWRAHAGLPSAWWVR